MRRGYLVLLSLFWVGCARPIYENAPASPSGNYSREQSILDCGLKFNRSGHCLLWRWEKLPTAAEPGSLIFKIVRANALDQTAVPVEPDGAPDLVLWMPSMDHGSSPTSVQRVDVGSFRAIEVFFIMPGEWQMKFQIKKGSEIRDEVVVTLTLS